MKNYFQRLAGLAIAIALFSSCDDDDSSHPPQDMFQQIGLDNLKVYDLVVYGSDSLFAATDDGVYVKDIESADPFVQIGLDGRNVLDIIVFAPQHIIATTGNRGFTSDTPGIHKTLNGGTSWAKSSFGDADNEETAYSLSQHPSAEGTVYATGSAVIAKSVDYGTNWDVIWGNWGGFASGTSVAKINPFVETDLWYGGQGGIENGYLGYLRHEQQVKQWDNLVDNPTVAVEVAFINPGSHIFAGFEGALMKTSNNGDTWKQVIDGHTNGLRFFYGIDKSKVRQGYVYAGGWLKGVEEQSLVFYVSDDFGETWQTKIFDDEKAGGIYSIEVVSKGTRDRVFVGLDGGGVYEVRL
jgi:hypothetical protein